MPDKVIDIPGVGVTSFPDSMSDDEITSTIKTKILKQPMQVSAPLTGTEKARNFMMTGSTQGPGHYSPQGKGTFEFPGALNKAAMAASVIDPAIGIAKNPQGIVNLGKSLYTGVKEGLPKIIGGGMMAGMGAAAETGLEGISHLPQYARYVAMYPGIKMVGQGIKDGAQAFGREFTPPNLGKFVTSEATQGAPLIPGPSNKWAGSVDNPVKSVEPPTEAPKVELPSGRKPGPAEIKPAPERAAPQWKGFSGQSPQQPLHEPVGPVDLPSGRKIPTTEERIAKINDTSQQLKSELDRQAPGNAIGEVKPLSETKNPKTLDFSHGRDKSLVKEAREHLNKMKSTGDVHPLQIEEMEGYLKELEDTVAKGPGNDKAFYESAINNSSNELMNSIKRTEEILGGTKSADQAAIDSYWNQVNSSPSPNLKVNNPSQPLSEGLSDIRVQKSLESPSYKEPGTKLDTSQIESAQTTDRLAKENKLAMHLFKEGVDLNNIKPTSELLKALGKDAGLKYEPSLKTLEGAIRRARVLKASSNQ